MRLYKVVTTMKDGPTTRIVSGLVSAKTSYEAKEMHMMACLDKFQNAYINSLPDVDDMTDMVREWVKNNPETT